MNKEFFDAIDLLVKEKGIQRETLMEGIKAALLKSCEQFYGTSENIVIEEDEENRQFRIYRELEVVDHIEEGMETRQRSWIPPRMSVPLSVKNWILRTSPVSRLRTASPSFSRRSAKKNARPSVITLKSTRTAS